MSYFKNISKTGALRSTPKSVIHLIMQEIMNVQNPDILELGCGKGEITKEIYSKYSKEISFDGVEINKEMVDSLKQYCPNFRFINLNVLDLKNILHENKKYDFIITSLPFTFFRKNDQLALLKLIQQHLKKNGKVLFIFHAFWLVRRLKKYFSICKFVVKFTLPIYFFLILKKNQNLL